MANKIVLISDDSDFFDYIRSKLELRKSDELFYFSFDAIPEKLHLLETAVLIVNSENAREKTLDLLRILSGTPIVVISYNDDETFRKKCYRAGMYDFMPLLTPDSEFRARMLPIFSVASLLEKNKQYREVLVSKNLLAKENELFLDYNYVLDMQLERINNTSERAVFMAISPSDKIKFLLQPKVLETAILSNIRRNDILMSYAANKYFLLLFDADIKSAQKLWQKILVQLPQKVHAGFCTVTNQKRQQLINEVLNKLHEAINYDKDTQDITVQDNMLNKNQSSNLGYSNFKMFRQEFVRKVEQVITPAFYHIQQKYLGKLSGVMLEHGIGDGYGTFYIKGKSAASSFRITSPGFSKINIDITFQKDNSEVDVKRISLEPEELELGLLEDLLEQFILEYKRSTENVS